MYSVLDTLSEYTYFYLSKNITSYTFVACFENRWKPQCILNQHDFHATSFHMIGYKKLKNGISNAALWMFMSQESDKESKIVKNFLNA